MFLSMVELTTAVSALEVVQWCINLKKIADKACEVHLIPTEKNL